MKCEIYIDNTSEMRYNRAIQINYSALNDICQCFFVKVRNLIEKMCDFCWRMRCPRNCPSYEGKRGRRERSFSDEWMMRIPWTERKNDLENRMDQEGRANDKGEIDGEEIEKNGCLG